jgi:hypothetical protein
VVGVGDGEAAVVVQLVDGPEVAVVDPVLPGEDSQVGAVAAGDDGVADAEVVPLASSTPSASTAPASMRSRRARSLS